ncbi:uncharacterized protein [Ptychodera flava]|uniref:uncharacterized protein n=1 Tax=Ptychodera flava TaxID=63121 RepID=UPI003969C4B6
MSCSERNVYLNVTLPMSTLEYWSRPCGGENFTNMEGVDDLRAKGLLLTSDEYKNVYDLKKTLERRTAIPADRWQVRDEHGRRVKKTTPGGRYSASPVQPGEETSSDTDSPDEAEEGGSYKKYEEFLRLKDSSCEN